VPRGAAVTGRTCDVFIVADRAGAEWTADARLEDVRRDRRERRQAGRGGGITCPQCGTRSQAGANFCASCGAALAPAAEAHDAPDDVQATTVIVDEQVTTVIVDAEPDPQPTTAIPPQSGGDG